MKKNVTVLFASQYSFSNDKGETLEGTSVNYAMTDNLLAPVVNEDGSKGTKIAKESLEYDDFDKFTEVPAIYSATFDFKVNSKGKAELRATDFTFVKGFASTK